MDLCRRRGGTGISWASRNCVGCGVSHSPSDVGLKRSPPSSTAGSVSCPSKLRVEDDVSLCSFAGLSAAGLPSAPSSTPLDGRLGHSDGLVALQVVQSSQPPDAVGEGNVLTEDMMRVSCLQLVHFHESENSEEKERRQARMEVDRRTLYPRPDKRVPTLTRSSRLTVLQGEHGWWNITSDRPLQGALSIWLRLDCWTSIAMIVQPMTSNPVTIGHCWPVSSTRSRDILNRARFYTEQLMLPGGACRRRREY